MMCHVISTDLRRARALLRARAVRLGPAPCGRVALAPAAVARAPGAERWVVNYYGRRRHGQRVS